MPLIQHAVMFLWLPVVALLFLAMPPKRAVVVAFFAAWMFLPQATYGLPGLPDYTKMSATTYGVLLGALLFDWGRLMRFRPRWFDLPVVIFTVVAPLGAALTNPEAIGRAPGTTLYDGVSEAIRFASAWLLPYFIGRCYFTSAEDLRLLAVALIVGALVYVPICWFEARFSPQLHYWVYGRYQHHFVHAKGLGGFRPRGFMQTGLMVGTFICSAALVAWVLWRSRSPIRVRGHDLPAGLVFAVLLATAVVVKSVGAFVLAFGGLCALFASRWTGTRAVMIALLCVAPVFVTVRAFNLWTGADVIAVIRSISEEKGHSLQYRFDNDEVLAAHALEKPWFGWGGYNRNIVRNKAGTTRAVTDGMWIIALGKMGLVGLGAYIATLAMPMVLFLRRQRPVTWFTPTVAPVTALVTVIMLYQLDGLFNAMENPIFMVMAGGVCSFLAVRRFAPTAAMPGAVDPPGPPPGRDASPDADQPPAAQPALPRHAVP